MELEQLRQLKAIAGAGTLSAAAEELNLSQSALSRSVQRLERDCGMPLFDRTKNSMALNDAGRLVLRHAEAMLAEEQRLQDDLLDLRRRASSLHVGSCAPAPLWQFVPLIVEYAPDLAVIPQTSSSPRDLERRLMAGELDFAILPSAPGTPGVRAITVMHEDLFVMLPEEHELAGHASLSLADLDGETFLLYAGVGFWRGICERLMPHSHYVVQTDHLVFSQLAQTSPLPSFATNVTKDRRLADGRRAIPLADEDVHVTFYLAALDGPGARWHELLNWLERRLAAEASA